MFAVEPVATDDGLYKVTRSDGIRLYIHREQRLIGPFASFIKIIHIPNCGENYNRFKHITKAKSYSTNNPKITLFPIESYTEYINRHTKKSDHEKDRCINAINEYLQAIDNSIIRTDPIKDTVSTFSLQITDIRGTEYRLKLSGTNNYIVYNSANGFIGTALFMFEFFKIDYRNNIGNFYKSVNNIKTKFPSETASVSFNKNSIVMSIQFIDRIIEKRVPPDNQEAMKLKVRMLHEEIQRICTEDATVSSESINETASVITDDKSVSEHDTMTELISLIEVNMKDPTVNEFNRIVASIANNILLNQTVAISKIDDGTLEVHVPAGDLNDYDYIFSKEYLIRTVEVYRLLDKLYDKGIITDINGDILTVDDTDFFIDALSYKLMKISSRNKESNIDSISVES